ncbi:MAG: hypothetical protein JSW11_10600 [Candidatus Heimdallarchaeota archaeon]|nr:MAG: hypothetical protein JSW11_10600 [Candidatus Heimdallarchaeota archaeon]
MPSPSKFKKFLITLRKKELIDENQYVEALEGLKGSFKTDGDQLIPLLDMYGLKQIDDGLQRLNQSLTEIDTEIKKTIQAWETKALSKNETKKILTEFVSEQNKLIKRQKKLQLHIQDKISRLKSLEKGSNIEMGNFVISLLQTTDIEEIRTLLNEFMIIWSKYSRGVEEQRPHKLDEVELDILRTLMIPIPESERIIFNLDEVIQPQDFQDSLLPQKIPEEIPKEHQVEELDSVKEQKIPSTWDLVGLVAFDTNKTPIGLFRPPIMVNKSVFLPIIREKPLSMSVLKKGYQDFFNQVGLDLNVTTTQQIRNEIAKRLEIPEELALQPSLFNQWMSELGFEVVPAKPQLTKAWFAETESIDQSSEVPVVKKADLKKISIPAWIPARGEKVAQQIHLGKQVVGMAGSNFGLIVGIMHETPFGQVLVVERKVPPSYLVDLFLKGLGKESLAELRFTITQELQIGEGEVFSSENLWLMSNKERLLISPHEILASYYTVLPAAAFNFTDKIHAKVGVYFHSVPETFRYLIGKPLIKNEDETGLIYGFSVNEGELAIVWSSKEPIEIIKQLGKKSSEQYVNRLRRRISLALDTSYEKSIWPSNLARYFLNFIWMEEQLTLEKTLTIIKERFFLQEVLFSEIEEISKDGLKCRGLTG